VTKKSARVQEKKKRKGKGVAIKGGLYCPVCDKRMDNYENYRRHMISPKHITMVKLRQAGAFPKVSIKKGEASTSGGGGGLLFLLLLGLIAGSLLYYAKKKDEAL